MWLQSRFGRQIGDKNALGVKSGQITQLWFMIDWYLIEIYIVNSTD